MRQDLNLNDSFFGSWLRSVFLAGWQAGCLCLHLFYISVGPRLRQSICLSVCLLSVSGWAWFTAERS